MGKYFIGLFSVLSLLSCNCLNVDCETGPPNLNIRLIDSTGVDPIANQTLLLENVQFKNLSNSEASFSTYFNGVIGFSLDTQSDNYELSIHNIPIDTFDITLDELEGECCSSFTVRNVNNNNGPVPFSPFLIVNL